MASTTATDMARSFKTLSAFWKTKAGRRDHVVPIFTNTRSNEPKTHIPFLLTNLFNALHKSHGDFVTIFKNCHSVNVKVSNDQTTVWIYSMRQSDALPKSAQDVEILYGFVKAFLDQHLDSTTYSYMLDNINITVYFFIWFFTTPNFFFNKTEISHTTRNGVNKVWRSILLIKPPTTPASNSASNSASNHIKGVHHQNNILSNLETQKQNIITNINTIICSVCVDFNIDWTDDVAVRIAIAQTMQLNHKLYINGKKQKKIQRLYQDLQKISTKIKTAHKSIRKEHNNMSVIIEVPEEDSYDWGNCGSPPDPPKLVRQNAQHPHIEHTLSPSYAASDNTLNCPLPIHSIEHVPDSWEDL